MRGHRNQRSAIGIWTKLFPYLGIAFLFAINFYWIYNSNRSHEGTHSQINTAVKEKENMYKSIGEREDLLSETIDRLESKERELEEMEEKLREGQDELKEMVRDLSKKINKLGNKDGNEINEEEEEKLAKIEEKLKDTKKMGHKRIRGSDSSVKPKPSPSPSSKPKTKPAVNIGLPSPIDADGEYAEVVSVDPNDVVSKKTDKPHVGQDPVEERSVMSEKEFNEIDIKKTIEDMVDADDKLEALKISSDWMSAKIIQVQNPTDCDNAKWNYCRVYNNCGGGCVIHQLAYCFLVGLAKNRITYIGDGWRYLRECENTAWTCAFQPVTNCTPPRDMESAPAVLNGATDDDKVWSVDLFSRGVGARFVKWAASDGFHTNTPFYLPAEIEQIRTLHGDTRVWLVGHVEKYFLRMNQEKKAELAKRTADVSDKFIHPVVGIHVRRTDHGREAPFRQLNEYMVHVQKWWDDEKIADEDKRIYLATDEPSVLEEAKKDYKNVQWLNYEYNDNPSGFTKEFLDQGRSSMDGFYSLFADWYFLSRVDFMVGTSSSQVGRMAYELMQNYHADASKNFVSLDDPWYFP